MTAPRKNLSPAKSNAYAGMTNNAEYNAILAYWDRMNRAQQFPRCECCDADLTGQDVWEGRYGWYGICCPDAEDGHGGSLVDEARAERRQMGII